MELSPIREVRAVGALRAARKVESEVEPPFAFAPAARMEDDDYRGEPREMKRGLEEEDPEPVEPDESDGHVSSFSGEADSGTNIDYLA